MNEQNNNFDSQYDNQSIANSNNPTRPVTNKFFPADLFEDSNINEVGSSMTTGANSQFISKTTWGVGRNKFFNNDNLDNSNNLDDNNSNIASNENNTSTEVLSLFDEGIETLMEDVNGTIYNGEQPEILDTNIMNNNSINQSTSNNMNNYNFEQSYVPEQNFSTPPSYGNGEQQSMANNALVDSNYQTWMGQQPLSSEALGVSNPNGSDAPAEVVEDTKYINRAVTDQPAMNTMLDDLLPKQAPVPQPGLFDQYEEKAPEIDEVKLCNEYVGDAFTKITMSPFSFSVLLFGSAYFAYRKMLIIAFIVLGIEFALMTILPSPIGYIALLILRLILALITNQLYLKIAFKRVTSLRKKHPKMNQYELSGVAKKNGGTNFILALLVFIIFSAIVAISGVVDFISDLTSNIPQNKPADKTEEVFDGTFNYESYNIRNIVNITIPLNFTKTGETQFTYTYISSDDEANNQCMVSFNAISGYKTGEDLINDIATFNKDVDNVSKLEANGITWYNFYTQDDTGKIYYRGTTIDKKVLLLEYIVGANSDASVCEPAYATILDSISIKKENKEEN